MVRHQFIAAAGIACFILVSCSGDSRQDGTLPAQKQVVCSDGCTAKNTSLEMSCKLTTPELRQRKETVMANLKRQVTEKRELQNGMAFKFPGTDKVLDELTEFIKTERACCDFFTFALSVSGDKSEAWLELTGAEGVKEFIISELGL